MVTWQLTDPRISLSNWVTLLSLNGRCLCPLRIPRMTFPRPAMVMLPLMVLVLSQHPKSIKWSLDLPPRRIFEGWSCWLLASAVTECWYKCRVKIKWESRPWYEIFLWKGFKIFLSLKPESQLICCWEHNQDSNQLFLQSRREFHTSFAADFLLSTSWLGWRVLTKYEIKIIFYFLPTHEIMVVIFLAETFLYQ